MPSKGDAGSLGAYGSAHSFCNTSTVMRAATDAGTGSLAAQIGGLTPTAGHGGHGKRG